MKKKITLGLFLAYILFCGFLFIKTRFITTNQHLVLQSEKAQKYKSDMNPKFWTYYWTALFKTIFRYSIGV
ncbi:hypothetical protein ACI3PI_06700, partial [Lactobacillus helveticus]